MKRIAMVTVIMTLFLTACGNTQGKDGVPRSGLNFRILKEMLSGKHENTGKNDVKAGKAAASEKNGNGMSSGADGNDGSADLADEKPAMVQPQQSGSSGPDAVPKNTHVPDKKAEELCRLAGRAADAGDNPKALALYTEAAETDLFYTEPLEGLYKTYLALKDFEKAALYRQMAVYLRSALIASNAAELQPPVTSSGLKAQLGYDGMNADEKKKYDDSYSYLVENPAYYGISIAGAYISLAAEYREMYWQNGENKYLQFSNTIYSRARKTLSGFRKMIPDDDINRAAIASSYLTLEVKTAFWSDEFSEVKKLCEEFMELYPEQYAEEDLHSGWYLPSLEKLKQTR